MPTLAIPVGFLGNRPIVLPRARVPIWESCDSRDERVLTAQHHQDAGRLYRHHGGRGAAYSDGAEGQRVDAEPPRTQPGGSGWSPATGRRRAQEHPQGRDVSGNGEPLALPACPGDVVHSGTAAVRRDSLCGTTSSGLRLLVGAARPLRASWPDADGGGRSSHW